MVNIVLRKVDIYKRLGVLVYLINNQSIMVQIKLLNRCTFVFVNFKLLA